LRERESGSRGRGRGRESLRGGLPAQQGVRLGAPTPDPEIMTSAEGRHLTD